MAPEKKRDFTFFRGVITTGAQNYRMPQMQHSDF